jgi:type I restriction enzyme S subunit
MRETLVKAEEFKDSLVGRIPKDWDVSSLAALTQYITYGFTNPMPTTKDGPWMITAFDIANGKICYGQARHTSEKAYKNDLTQKSKPNLGDILITKDGTLGRIAVVDRTGICINQSVACLRPLLDTDVRFLVHYLRSDIGQERMLADAGGSTIKHIYITKLAQMEVPVPPREERTRISDILDTIDSTIAHTSSLIAKLKQMKAGLLHDLLTRGLDENGELRDAIGHPEQFKDSPLGQIPKDWLVVSVGECLARIEQGWSPDCESNNTPLGEWGVLKTTAVVWEGYQDFENKQLPSHLQPDPNYEVKPGDVLMTRAGPNSRVGVVALVRQTQGKLMLSDKLYRLIPRDYVKPDFLAYTLSGNRTQGHLSTLKTGLAESQTNISQEIVRTLLIALPKIQEQERIISILDTHDTRIRTEEAYREKLKLQKKGLMHDLLTGKVRVKDADKFTSASDTV